MRKIIKGLFGFIFGGAISVFSALVFMLIAQAGAGGITSFWGESWLYYAVVIPFSITFAALGVYADQKPAISNKSLWVLSFICAFLVTLFSGTIGAIFGEYMARGGIETINIEGTLVWGTIYAFILLPLTTPLARVLVGLFYSIMNKLFHEK